MSEACSIPGNKALVKTVKLHDVSSCLHLSFCREPEVFLNSFNGKIHILEGGEPTDSRRETGENAANCTPAPSKCEHLALAKEDAFSGHCRRETKEKETALSHHLQ